MWASAYARFEELRAVSKVASPPRMDRIALADAHIQVLYPRVSRLFVARPIMKPSVSLRVAVDGVTYTDVSLGEGVLVDPGPHEIEVSAPGYIAYSTRAEVNGRDEAVRVDVSVPPLEPIPEPPHIVRSYTTRPAGLVAGGVGLLTVATGVIFGVLAMDANRSGKEKCHRETNPGAPPSDFEPGSGVCLDGSATLESANADKSRASDFANVSNVLVPMGVIGLAVGTYLFFRSTTHLASSRAVVVPGAGGAHFELRF